MAQRNQAGAVSRAYPPIGRRISTTKRDWAGVHDLRRDACGVGRAVAGQCDGPRSETLAERHSTDT